MSIEEKVLEIVGTHFLVHYDINVDDNFITDLKGDELDNMEICMLIESEFNVEIIDADMEEINTAQGYIDYLKNEGVE
ncbi:MAG: phosphopantetheine-binding protein [Gammaproteobacteria bacterium]|nr:phosphopantetheine-binding protein [Gammaproteobacteria bacterium]